MKISCVEPEALEKRFSKYYSDINFNKISELLKTEFIVNILLQMECVTTQVFYMTYLTSDNVFGEYYIGISKQHVSKIFNEFVKCEVLKKNGLGTQGGFSLTRFGRSLSKYITKHRSDVFSLIKTPQNHIKYRGFATHTRICSKCKRYHKTTSKSPRSVCIECAVYPERSCSIEVLE